jgi:predicted dehydrogenase
VSETDPIPHAQTETAPAASVDAGSAAPSRREFLGTSAAVTAAAAAGGIAAVGAPTIVPSTVFAKDDQPAPSDRIVFGLIGCGDLGRRHHLNNMIIPRKVFDIAAVCDVDRNHRDQAAKDVFAKQGKRVATYKDFRDLCDRKDIDAVMVVTPDHWHALAATYAMESGKDVYCEKPLTLAIDEGRKMVQAARRYGRVTQTGNQQRSDKRFRLAVELVRSGKIGKLTRIDTHIGGIDSGNWQPAVTPPPELDWDMWLGPAPYVDYRPNQVHYQFRWFSDYSGGKMTDWGAHHNDIAQWAMGQDGPNDPVGPVKVKAERAVFHEKGPHDVAGAFDVKYTYANGVELHCHSDGENGVKFTGTDGFVFISRGRIEYNVGGEVLVNPLPKDGKGVDIYSKFQPGSLSVKLYESPGHHDNWIECIKSRKTCICDFEVGHRSATVCHLGNIAIRLGRELTWDPAAEKFVNDDAANRFLSRPMRAPWHL